MASKEKEKNTHFPTVMDMVSLDPIPTLSGTYIIHSLGIRRISKTNLKNVPTNSCDEAFFKGDPEPTLDTENSHPRILGECLFVLPLNHFLDKIGQGKRTRVDVSVVVSSFYVRLVNPFQHCRIERIIFFGAKSKEVTPVCICGDVS